MQFLKDTLKTVLGIGLVIVAVLALFYVIWLAFFLKAP